MATPTREDHKAMIATWPRWPQFPVLPLKRRKTDGTFPDMGILIEPSYGQPTTVFEVNMFEVLKYKTITRLITSDCPRKVYADIEGILDDGWEVD